MALSHAPPPEVIEIATKMPVTMTPSSRPPSISRPLVDAEDEGDDDREDDRDQAAGISISRCAVAVTMRTQRA